MTELAITIVVDIPEGTDVCPLEGQLENVCVDFQWEAYKGDVDDEAIVGIYMEKRISDRVDGPWVDPDTTEEKLATKITNKRYLELEAERRRKGQWTPELTPEMLVVYEKYEVNPNGKTGHLIEDIPEEMMPRRYKTRLHNLGYKTIEDTGIVDCEPRVYVKDLLKHAGVGYKIVNSLQAAKNLYYGVGYDMRGRLPDIGCNENT